MVSSEYFVAVKSRNILRTRIMLKDSMVVEPTFSQFDEMLSLARKVVPEIIVPFDDEVLEMDSSKWTRELMNMELVQIINNFSEQRIAHLKKVISVILAEEIRRINVTSAANCGHGTRSGSATKPSEDKKQEQRKALGIITSAGNDVAIVMDGVKSKNGMWDLADVSAIEKATNKMIGGIQKYKDNK